MQTIFISSTFQDMHQERDIIQSRVLPRIKEFAKHYGETVELCDLRWGIDDSWMDEQKSTAKILQICFDEIDTSRPFFLCLLGDRYGWIPDSDLVEQILHTQGRSIPEGRDKSVTELEILYGAFHHQHPGKLSRFYFRTITNPKPRLFQKSEVPAVYLSGSREDRMKMQALKEKITMSQPEHVRHYRTFWNGEKQALEGLEDFAEMVFQDLKQMLEQRFGAMRDLSEFELRRRQQRYAMEQDRFFELSDPLKLNMPQQYQQMLCSGQWPQGKPNLFLVSKEMYGINRLAASVAHHYEQLGYHVIPYDCAQSLLSGTMGGLLSYLIGECAELASVTPEPPPAENPLQHQKEEFHRMVQVLCGQGQKVLLLIRNLHRLEEENLLWWFPVERSDNVRFLISTDRTPVGPAHFEQVTQVLYFQSEELLDKSTWINRYMERYRKQPDSATKEALMERSQGKHPQYLEFLMQRLLLLDRHDFAAIKENGGDIQAISGYLCQTLRRQPDNLEDIVMGMVERLEKEVGKNVTHGVLGMLLAAPYGLPRTVIQQVLRQQGLEYSNLTMSTFCRMLPSLVNETLDGYLRCIDSPAVRILRNRMIGHIQYWSRELEQYLAACLEDPRMMQSGYPELISNQYLQIALEGQRLGALKRYIRSFRQDAAQVAAVLHKLLSAPGAVSWVKQEIRTLRPEEFGFLCRECYQESKNNGWTDRAFFEIWEEMAQFATQYNQRYPCRNGSMSSFFLTYQCGEMAYLSGSHKAEDFLLRAKKLSKEDFTKYPNKVWKVLHGVALTEEEMVEDREVFGDTNGEDGGAGPMLAHGTEVQDMLTEYSWSNIIRIINRYLAAIYEKNGDWEKAEALEAEIAELTRMLDPNPLNQKQAEMASGITVIMPDTQPSAKPSYRPDLRRNTAIQLAKEATSLKKQGSYAEALEKYRQSNEMLLRIQEDAAVLKKQADPAHPEEQDQAFEQIALECLRDLSLNYKGMLGCAISLNRPDRIWEYIDRMLECGIAYDREKNNAQSKGDLEECYAVAASCCIGENTSDYEKCLNYCANHFRYREAAAAKGEKLDEYVLNFLKNTEALFYHCVTHCPGLGNQAVDVLLEVSNQSSMYRDFDGYCRYTDLMSDLLDWMWKNGYRWVGEQTSLESLYIHNIENLCRLWKQHNMVQRLERDACRLQSQLPFLTEEGPKLQGAQAVSLYGLQLFQEGNYAKAAEVFGQVVQCLDTLSTQACPQVLYIQHLGRYLAALSEAGQLENADRAAQTCERRLQEALQSSPALVGQGSELSPSATVRFLHTEMAMLYLNRAVLLSRMGDRERAVQYLQLAEDWLRCHEEVHRTNPELARKVQFFKMNGLPEHKQIRDGEQEYRMMLEELTAMLRDRPCTLSQAAAVEHKLKALEAVEEHGIFRNCQQMAQFWHDLFRLYYSLKQLLKARQALLSAKAYAQEDEQLCALYGNILSDLCAVTKDPAECMDYANEAIRIFDTLRKTGKDDSLNGLALAYHNRGLLRMRQGDLEPAQEDVEQAIVLFGHILRHGQSEEAERFLSEARRLLAFIKHKRT